MNASGHRGNRLSSLTLTGDEQICLRADVGLEIIILTSCMKLM